MNFTVPAGSYTVIDSSPGTWSQNTFSGGKGFTRIFGSFVAKAPPLPAPSKPPTGSHPNCSGTPPSTFLIYPNHVAAGGSVSFLLGCGHAVAQGFQGAFKPLKVEIYDEA